MEIGAVYKHKYMGGLTCQILALTQKGAKVKETQLKGKSKKEKQAFYDRIDFHDSEKGIWLKNK